MNFIRHFKYILLALLISTPSISKITYGNLVIERVNSVYDGDTIRADIPMVHPVIGKNISIRIYGYDTPELRDKRRHIRKKAYRARNHLRSIVNGANSIELRNVRRGKYFRLVGELYIDGNNVKDSMIRNGYAKNYYGGKKPSWK